METSVELAGLASAAATRLVDLLATDGWAAVKSSVLSLWRTAHPDRVEQELDEARAELIRAERTGDETELHGLLAAEWQARMIRLMTTRPDTADELRALLAGDLRPAGAPEQQVTGSLTLEAHVRGGDAFLAGRDMNVTRGGRA
ncbi:hypothetical protein [Streptomyces sp. SID8016]|uniref:hypothetical protein n=1 Tax=Streptomyces sp. SID8016 TaxID=2706098 RepID=UPI0013DB7866|nr:hypothetical protein [Streptomyces sp. SID8016]